MEDEQILELYFARDERAIEETAQKYGRLCYHVCYHILRSDETAEECVNDTYLGVWNRIPPVKPSRLAAFVCRIARNISLNKSAFDHAAKRSAAVLSLSELSEAIADGGSWDDAEDTQLAALLSAFLRTEKADARNVFLRKYWFFDTVEEIAARYGFSESKVKAMLHRTRNRLRTFLTQKGVFI